MTDITPHDEPQPKPKKPRRNKKEILQTGLDSVERLSRDLREASVTLSDREARFLCDSYYSMQENRKRGHAQVRALSESKEPHAVLTWFALQSEVLENQIERALDGYSKGHLVGRWLRGTAEKEYKDGIFGVGPVLAAGMQAAIYMGDWCGFPHCRGHTAEECAAFQADEKRKPKLEPHTFQPVFSCPTYGHYYQYAGLAGDGQRTWEKGEKRPWNAGLKTLCWKFGDVMTKFSNDERCWYGRLYRERKEKEVALNTSGAFKHVAEARLARPKVSKEANYHKQGILSPGHIDQRARRYATKRFLADLHTVWYWLKLGTLPPMPYPMAYLGHAHLQPPPISNIPGLLEAIKAQWK